MTTFLGRRVIRLFEFEKFVFLERKRAENKQAAMNGKPNLTAMLTIANGRKIHTPKLEVLSELRRLMSKLRKQS